MKNEKKEKEPMQKCKIKKRKKVYLLHETGRVLEVRDRLRNRRALRRCPGPNCRFSSVVSTRKRDACS